MNELQQILRGLNERELALAVSKKHDDARGEYSIRGVTVGSYSDFERVIADYYAYHFSTCIAPGAKLPAFEAKQRAKELLAEEYRRHGLTVHNACEDAISGVNGGLRHILDLICDGLKRESEYRYAEQLFDTYVEANGFEGKVEIIRQLLAHYPTILSDTVNPRRPEAQANDYKLLVRAILDARREVGKAARR